jgi:hypothetical protein
MVASDWRTVKIPVGMLESIDKFVESDVAKKNGIFSRSDFLTRLIAGWFSNFESDFDLFGRANAYATLKDLLPESTNLQRFHQSKATELQREMQELIEKLLEENETTKQKLREISR